MAENNLSHIFYIHTDKPYGLLSANTVLSRRLNSTVPAQ